MSKVTIQEQLECVERELAYRHRCYPRWVEQGRMQLDQASRELVRMEAVRDTLKAMQPQQEMAL